MPQKKRALSKSTGKRRRAEDDDGAPNDNNDELKQSSSNKRKRRSYDGNEVMVVSGQNAPEDSGDAPTNPNALAEPSSTIVAVRNDEPNNDTKAMIPKRSMSAQLAEGRKVVSSSSLQPSAISSPDLSVIHNRRRGNEIAPVSVIAEEEIPLHLEERGGFSAVVTPEISQDGNRRTIDLSESSHLQRALFASTFVSSVRFIGLRFLALCTILIGIYYSQVS